VSAAAKTSDAIFAANRAVGRIDLSVKTHRGVTRRAVVHEAGSLRVRCPNTTSAEMEAVILNTAGGVAGGDRFGLDIAVGEGARLVVTTAAAEKVYRTLGPEASIDVALRVDAGGSLAWLPQETILFDRACLSRSIEVDLAADAGLVLAEAIVFGRSGMGEAVAEGALVDRWRVRRDGRLIYAESVRLDGAIDAKLAAAAVAGCGIAVATVLIAPGDETTVAAIRACADDFAGEVGASAWNGIAAARLCAANGAALRHDLVRVMTAVRGALPRLWLN
jgi:urease accessory protein